MSKGRERKYFNSNPFNAKAEKKIDFLVDKIFIDIKQKRKYRIQSLAQLTDLSHNECDKLCKALNTVISILGKEEVEHESNSI